MKLITLLSAFAVTASAAPIPVFSTGVDDTGVQTAIGTVDTHWTLVSQPPTGTAPPNPVRFFIGVYAGETGASSGWVSPDIGGAAGASGFYTYAQAFDLTGFDLSSVVITGAFATDNDGELLINTTSLLTTGFADFGSLTSFSVPAAALVPGVNTFFARVNNGGGPTAFRVQFATRTGDLISPIPEPSTLALFVVGLIALRGIHRTLLLILARR